MIPDCFSYLFIHAGLRARLACSVLALLLQTSASLYDNGYNYSTTGFILATLAAVNWKVFDGTKQGLALALFISIAAPGSELLLNSQANLWHYSHPDVFGIVSWFASDAQPEAREEWC